MNYQILVTGSSHPDSIPKKLFPHAEKAAVSIVKAGHALLVDEMFGVGLQAALAGRKSSETATIVGYSPAANQYEHTVTYQLPMDEFSFLEFTGSEYVSRTTLAVRSSNAVIVIGGQLASLNQISAALELGKIVGVVTGSGGVADMLPQLVEHIAPELRKLLVSDSDATRLVSRTIQKISDSTS